MIRIIARSFYTSLRLQNLPLKLLETFFYSIRITFFQQKNVTLIKLINLNFIVSKGLLERSAWQMKSIVLSSIISLDNDKIVGKFWKFCFWPSRNLLPNQLSFKLNYETFCFIISFMNHTSQQHTTNVRLATQTFPRYGRTAKNATIHPSKLIGWIDRSVTTKNSVSRDPTRMQFSGEVADSRSIKPVRVPSISQRG